MLVSLEAQQPSDCQTYYMLRVVQISFIPYSVSRQLHDFFQSEFSKECDLVLPLSIDNSLSFLKAIK
jgi:hypothetical protein